MVAWWIIFAALIVLIPVGFGYFGVLCTKKFNPNEQQKKNMNVTLGKATLLFWLYDLLFMAIFNQWRVMIYIFGLLSIVIIFTNIIGVFLSENKLLNKMISFDLLVGAGLSVYLIYILPNEQLKTIVTAVVAALYGGILTLVGVAWTIRHSDKERKDEEKKKAKPIFTFNMVLDEIKDIRTKKVCFDVNNLFLEVKDGLDNSYYYEIKVLSLNLLPGVVRNLNKELLHTIREIKEISIDAINKRTV